MRSGRHSTRGMTLLEAVVSALVLSIGVGAIFSTLTRVHAANKSAEVQTAAIDAFARFASEIKNARCDYVPGDPPPAPTNDIVAPNGVDPALTPNAGWQVAPIGTVTQAGMLARVQGANNTARLHLAFQVLGLPPGAHGARSRTIEVAVQNVRDDGTIAPVGTTGPGIRTFSMTKNCTPRTGAGVPRGEYPP